MRDISKLRSRKEITCFYCGKSPHFKKDGRIIKDKSCRKKGLVFDSYYKIFCTYLLSLLQSHFRFLSTSYVIKKKKEKSHKRTTQNQTINTLEQWHSMEKLFLVCDEALVNATCPDTTWIVFFFYIVQYFRVNHTSRLVCGRVEIREKIYIDYLNL